MMSALIRNPRITPFLWFNENAEEAVRFYLDIFPNSRILDELPNPAGSTPSKARLLTIAFELDGVPFTALNGGPAYSFNPAVSFVVHCAAQQEIDHYWARLTANGGKEIQCGWLVDKFGVSWQVVPERIGELVRHPKAMQALMQMIKIDTATLEEVARE